MSFPCIRFSNITCLTKVILSWLCSSKMKFGFITNSFLCVPYSMASILTGRKYCRLDLKITFCFHPPFMLERKFVNCQVDLIFPLDFHLFAVIRISPLGFTHLQCVAGKRDQDCICLLSEANTLSASLLSVLAAKPAS